MAESPKIAVIDDDESVRDALQSFLKSVGFRAESFASAAEFLKSGQLLGLACLILDVRMPGMSGIELQDRLIASHDGVPIIFISAHADEDARARALASGAIAFLAKPFSDKALLDLAVKLNNHPKDVGAADIDALRAHSFGDQHILEMVIMVGLAKFSNFVAFGLGTVPDFDASQVTGHLGSEKKLNPLPNTLPLIDDEDVDLVHRTRSGRLDAFDELVRRHQQRIYRTLMAITRNPDEAEDGTEAQEDR